MKLLRAKTHCSRLSCLLGLFLCLATLSAEADFPTLAQFDPDWPLDGRTAYQLILPPQSGLETDVVRWTGRFYRGGAGPIESFTLRVYDDAGGEPGGVIREVRIDEFSSERLLGNEFFYSATIPQLLLPAGANVWLGIQAKAPAVPQWGIVRIESPKTMETRLLRAPEMGVFRWTSFSWFDGEGETSTCEAFIEPDIYTPDDSTGLRFPSVDFASPIIRPNPSTGFVRISFTLPATVHLDAGIFDIRGRRIRTLTDERRPDGPILLFWDGRNDEGTRLRSGIYFLRVDVNSREYFRHKILLLRAKRDG
jgi:hypothetical protein